MRALYAAEAYPRLIDRGVPTFDELLPYDPYDVEKLNASRRKGRTSDITLLSDRKGLAGPERQLVLDEVKRVRGAKARAQRRKEAVMAGILTTILLALCAYFSIAAAVALAQLTDDSTRIAFAIAQLSTYLPSCIILAMVLIWLRHVRRPSASSCIAVAGAILVFLVLFIQSVINLVLVSLQLNQFTSRCGVGIDYVWTLYSAGESCPAETSASTEAWTIAASLRLLLTTLLSLVWLWTIRRVVRALQAQLIVDPSLEPTAEIQAIFARRGVSMVTQDDAWSIDEEKETQLPAMPERRPPSLAPAEEKSWFWSTVDWLLGRTAPTIDAERGEVYIDRPTTPPLQYTINETPRGPTPAYRELFNEEKRV